MNERLSRKDYITAIICIVISALIYWLKLGLDGLYLLTLPFLLTLIFLCALAIPFLITSYVFNLYVKNSFKKKMYLSIPLSLICTLAYASFIYLGIMAVISSDKAEYCSGGEAGFFLFKLAEFAVAMIIAGFLMALARSSENSAECVRNSKPLAENSPNQ
jgi:hypothetical protein